MTRLAPARARASTILVLIAAGVGLVARSEPAAAQVADDRLFTFFQVEELEHRWNDGADSVNWDAQGWIGGDVNRAWLKTEGEQILEDTLEEAEVQLLYSRLIAPFWDLQAGGRYDFRPNPSRFFGVLGVQGLAPYFFEVDAAAFVSDDADVSARLEVEYELLLTQRLIAQPSAEFNFAIQEVQDLGVGSGVNDVELALRVRYEIIREIAPYLGVSWIRKLGQTADLARDEGDSADTFALLAGLRFWF